MYNKLWAFCFMKACGKFRKLQDAGRFFNSLRAGPAVNPTLVFSNSVSRTKQKLKKSSPEFLARHVM
jgi:hypothetical protein